MSGPSDFEVLRDCGSFEIGPGRRVRGRWQCVRDRVKADLRVFVERDGGGAVATRAGVCMEPAQLDEMRRLVAALVAARDEVLEEAGEAE